MARPCKSAGLLTECSQTKAEIAARQEKEAQLKGKSKKPPTPPGWLTANQKKIFRLIVAELKEADILCKLDVWILRECVVAIDNLEQIDRACNDDPSLIYDKGVLSAKEKYSKIFFRSCNELSLSPQSRAKIANINVQADDGTALLKAILAGDTEGEEDE